MKWLLDESDSARAFRLLNWARRHRIEMIAPALIATEVSNVVHRRVIRNELSPRHGRDLLDVFFTLELRLLEPTAYIRTSYDVAQQFGIATIYDALYVSLAQHLNCELWTADQRLIRTVRGRLPSVRALADFRDPDTSGHDPT